jgi:hypothetical protein
MSTDAAIPTLMPPKRRISSGSPSLLVPARSQKPDGGFIAPSRPIPSKGSMASKGSRASKVSVRKSRVSFAATKDTQVVNYYHSKHTEDPPAPRMSKRISLTYLEEPVITVYDQVEEDIAEGDEEGGDEDGGADNRVFMHKYKDAPVKEEEEKLTMAQTMRALSQKLLRYRGLKFIQVCCAIYIAVYTLAPIGGLRVRGGPIIDPGSEERTRRGVFLVAGNLRAIICANRIQLVFIGITRISAYMMYPGKMNGLCIAGDWKVA